MSATSSSSTACYDAEFAFAFGRPTCSAVFKYKPEDFIVREELGFELEGQGEHCYLRIRKRGCNTETLAKRLAKLAGVRVHDVGYSGLKDKQALTEQWFSVYLPGAADPDWRSIEDDQFALLEIDRHRKKLKKGVHKANHFTITLRDFAGTHEEFEQRIDRVCSGVPNYFGEQRFGYQRNNLMAAQRLFTATPAGSNNKKRRNVQHGLYLSAARSWLFNLMLSARVTEGSWNTLLPGDVCNLQGSGSVFVADADDESLQQRLDSGDLHLTAALWGKGSSLAGGVPATLERGVADSCRVFADGLERAGLQMQRRPMRVIPHSLQWQVNDDNTIQLSFSLPAGSFATAILREVITLVSPPSVGATSVSTGQGQSQPADLQ